MYLSGLLLAVELSQELEKGVAGGISIKNILGRTYAVQIMQQTNSKNPESPYS